MRIVVAMDSFKGSLDAMAACAAVARGIRRALPRAEVDLCPLADGGEGTAAVLQAILGGEWVEAEATGPLDGERVRASYLWIDGQRPSAVIDLAAASGLTLVPRERLDPLRATTLGTGELVRHAIDRGARRLWLALGGSATVDGAVGLATALGWRFLDRDSAPIGPGGGELERGLERLAATIERDLGVDVRLLPGAGAAGGAGAGAVAFLGARIAAGGRCVLRVSRFDARLRGADLVITGEGRLDTQSLRGKVVSAVARAAARRGVAVAAVAGRVTLDAPTARAHGIRATEAAAPPELRDTEALERAEPLLEAAAERLVARLTRSRNRA